MADGRMWSVRDKHGNDVYLTEERWHHITELINHPDMIHFTAELQETIRSGSANKIRSTRRNINTAGISWFG